MAEKIYSGIGPLPKGHRLATPKEAIEKKQVRLYGLRKIDQHTIDAAKKVGNIPETREKLLLRLVTLRGTISRHKGRYEKTKDETIKKDSYKLWQDAEKELKKIVPKLQKIEQKKEAAKPKPKVVAKEKTKAPKKVIKKVKI